MSTSVSVDSFLFLFFHCTYLLYSGITGKHNMMLEMQMFQKYNPSGSGHITLDEFCAVLAAETDAVLLKGLHAYASGSLANF